MERTDEKRKNGLRAKIVFIGNYKGGAGKTTSVLNFGTHFAKMGKGFWCWILTLKVL